MDKRQFQISEWCRRFVREVVQSGDICVDATAGTGQDTAFLAGLVGENGYVFAYDIQKMALKQTRERLEKAGLESRVCLLNKSHETMGEDLKGKKVSCVMFNFGYLPGGDHSICTKPDSSIRAVRVGLELLIPGGVMCLCIYSGGDTGYEEKEALLAYLQGLDQKQYLVIVSNYYNRKNDPPIPVLIYKI